MRLSYSHDADMPVKSARIGPLAEYAAEAVRLIRRQRAIERRLQSLTEREARALARDLALAADLLLNDVDQGRDPVGFGTQPALVALIEGLVMFGSRLED